ncbi:MAG TPA: di-heme oxidoredictase family protein [Thermoanaerobaculia bacterium]|nr:di-heme oxidoredictase family protein [Thermoanaerobaculia bacterium]
MIRKTLPIAVTAALALIPVVFASTTEARRRAQIGREVAVPVHLADGDEYRTPLAALVAHGKRLFDANWTHQEGAGRPLTKGTGKALADPTDPLVGARSMNRISGPDANSCTGCHNMPFGMSGGGGDFVTNVFVLGQRFDFVTFDPADTIATKGTIDERGRAADLQSVANLRATTGMFGAGYLEMLARQMTADLQAIRDAMKPGETRELVSKGVRFGKLTRRPDGLWDTSKVEGLSRLSLLGTTPTEWPTLIVRPWHQAGNVISLREFSNNAFNHHHGIQPTERFGLDTDADGDQFRNEMTRADVTAVSIYQATLQVPGRVIPDDPVVEEAVLSGEQAFDRIGCNSCHVSKLPLDNRGWIFTEPNPYNSATNLRVGEAKTVSVDLNSDVLPQPRLQADERGVVWVAAYTDFKLHDISGVAEDREPLDMNFGTWAPKFSQGNQKFLTKRLWGAANEPPYFHNGMHTTLRSAILAHAGEALPQRRAFEALSCDQQDDLVEFLKTLQVLPPGTKSLVINEKGQPKVWPPQ